MCFVLQELWIPGITLNYVDVNPTSIFASFLFIVPTMNTLHWFLSLDPCFVLQKKANSHTFSVETETSSLPESFGIPRGNLLLVVKMS